MRAKYRWNCPAPNAATIQKLAEETGHSSLFVQLLLNLGLDTKDKIDGFLQEDDAPLYDPFLFEHMQLAVDRIHAAIARNERIVVYGDYDADGVTSTTIMLKALHHLGADVTFYIPDRFTEGYGMNEGAIRKLHERETKLIITVDTGVASVEEIALANALGMDVILTDHHEFQSRVPEPYCFIHPKREGETFPFHELAGCGVAFKLATALGYPAEPLLQYVAIGTVADLVPLESENRRLVKRGLNELRQTDSVGLLALFETANITAETVDEETVGFFIGPRLNAVGRLQHAGDAVRLLMTEDEEEAKELAAEVSDLNVKRQQIVDKITKEAIRMVEARDTLDDVIVVAKEDWNPGVLGIVASRLVERLTRPVIALAIDPEKQAAKGSARSIPAYDLFANMSQCQSLMTHFGGHPMAAGLTIPTENIDALREFLNERAKEILTADDFKLSLEATAVCALPELNVSAIEQIRLLAPFGTGNPKPRIIVEKLTVKQANIIGKKANHGKFVFADTTRQSIDGVWFNETHRVVSTEGASGVSVIAEPSVNEWNGRKSPQLMIMDIATEAPCVLDWREKHPLMEKVNKLDESRTVALCFSVKQYERLTNESALSVVLYGREDWDTLMTNYDTALLWDVPICEADLERAILTAKHVHTWIAVGYYDSTTLVTEPTRDHYAALYRQLFANKVTPLTNVLGPLAFQLGLSEATILRMLAVFEELRFVHTEGEMVLANPTPDKKPLTDATAYHDTTKMATWMKTYVQNPTSYIRKSIGL
ncbi:MAG: single-stranded-DNA-specific exonuclease RecJ [Bacilli bacterium]